MTQNEEQNSKVTLTQPSPILMSLTPEKVEEDIITVDSRHTKGKKRARESSVIRNLNNDLGFTLQDVPSQSYIDPISHEEMVQLFDDSWYRDEHFYVEEGQILRALRRGEDISNIQISNEDQFQDVPRFRSAGIFGRQPEVKFVQAYAPLCLHSEAVADVDYEAVSVSNVKKTGQRFSRYFWTYGPLVRAFRSYLRRVIVITSIPLRNTKGTIMTALGVDGDNRTFPLAFAVANKETKANWDFFFHNLKQNVVTFNEACVIQTSRHILMAGLIRKYFPASLHVYCPFHLFGMILIQSRPAALLFQEAFGELDDETFNNKMSSIKDINSGIYEHLLNIGLEKWSELHITKAGFSRFMVNTTNHSLAWFAMLGEFSMHPLHTLVECIRTQIARHFFFYKSKAKANPSNYSQTAEWWLELNTSKALACVARPTSGGKFVVSTGQVAKQHIVEMSRNHCSCNFWQTMSIPCAHAIACLDKCDRYNIEDLVSSCYSSSTGLAIYSEKFLPHQMRNRVPIGMSCDHCSKHRPFSYHDSVYSWFEMSMGPSPSPGPVRSEDHPS